MQETDRLIRSYSKTDLEDMVRIWYEASIIAHSFVPASFWALQKSEMKDKYLPLAENFIYQEKEQIAGFISIVGERVCALFVTPEMQGKGIGRALMEHTKILKGNLSLKVYKENKRAFRFYEMCGFVAIGEEVDEYTGQIQILMECDKLKYI